MSTRSFLPNWATGAYSTRNVPLRPDMPTEFEEYAAKLGLITEKQMVHSERLRRWSAQHKNYRYVPERLLKLWGIRVTADFV